jgi:hypothetical protein
MKRIVITCLVTGIAVCTAHEELKAQSAIGDSALRREAINHAVQQYQQFFTPVLSIYNGPQYVDYMGSLRGGQPFFLSTEFAKGSIVYDNTLYDNIQLKYDLVKNAVVINDLSGTMDIALLNDRISSFKILDHSFVRLAQENVKSPLIATGFYEVLYKSSSTVLLKKESKKILEDLNAIDGIKRTIDRNVDYYIERNQKYYRVNSKSAVLNLFKDKEGNIKQFIRQNKLKFNNDIESDLVTVVAYADKTNR